MKCRHRWSVTVVNDYDGVSVIKNCRRCGSQEVLCDPASVRRELKLSRRRHLYRRRNR